MTLHKHKNSSLPVHEINNVGRPFPCHNDHILDLSDLSLGVEKKILNSLYDIYDHVYHKNPGPGGHEIYNFGRPSLWSSLLYTCT